MKLAQKLSQLSMWEDWQNVVKNSLPNFCASPIYVQQRSQTDADFERAAKQVAQAGIIDHHGKLRDEQFGAIVRETEALGRVTRMWIDSNVEIGFLRRHLDLAAMTVLDIGAGYGRLAVPLSSFVAKYHCVDAVPISTEICRRYTHMFAPRVNVLPLEEFCETRNDLGVDLAINVHSWNECSLEQVAQWISVLVEMKAKYLFVVSNGSISGGRSAYHTWGGGGESFRPLLESVGDLIAEESIGLSLHPHSLWKLK